jgi:hybrid polyketide synthase/nonribosomal peptide synthetase ACE1
VQALRAGEIHVALAAGSNLLLGPEPYIHESKLKMLSPDGRSRMWDEGANGYARGDGVAAVVLKTLSAALADGDNIECIIRETGVNQDGRSRGITMPSATAQAALIRETYAKAGLDPKSQTDRCQYFEAHGTGTPAGDPVEAEAVHTAFFGDRTDGGTVEEPLFVGSIKTIIGHTESTAGLAGILKVVQAMKHGYIPPNLLLNRLNPTVLPFYDHLHIPQKLTRWPKISGPRRASVNSFGFGGTNAHVILETFEPTPPSDQERPASGQSSFTPFLFSAQSKQSLLANLTAHAKYLENHPNTNPTDLAWTLRSRRSRLPLRVSFPASSIELLNSNLNELISNFQLQPRSATNVTNKAQLLGIFTGQGAQWARMGAELVLTSEYAANVLADLDATLAQLPEQDRPERTLRQELLAEQSSSNVNSASVSQPLCTAVQIILVRLLRLVGIQFAAVVGHSSGEIAAAFAAGYLSARDAIVIAYYRGLHSHLAVGPNGSQGAMLAVGTTLEDAEELCNDEEFKGRIKVAACNSPSSLTLSGDEDAITEIAEVFEDENKFVRILKVDKAYHSHHMLPCSQPYLDSMKSISVRKERLESSCTWVSSVHPDRPLDEMGDVSASYWVDNLLSPVMFRQAVERAMSLGPFDGAIEVGPHPALKGPVRDTLQNIQVDMPYTGLLQRNTDANQSISNALGYLWTHLDNISIDFDLYETAMGGPTSYRFISGLPVYRWNHNQKYWHESDLSRNIRQRSHPVHPLLGDLMPQSSPHQLTWKGILRPQDLPWIHDHRIQGQTVFPAAGYAATALETVPFLAREDRVQLVELEDLVIHQAMVFENDDRESGIEVRSVVSSINRDPGCITAYFTYEACIGNQQTFQLVASGQIFIIIGDATLETLPATGRLEPYMVDVPTETFYSALKDVGYGYSGSFKALSELKRKLGKASGTVAIAAAEPNTETLVVHPAVLDAAFHSIILAFSYPRDGLLRSLHLPTRIRRIRINPSLCGNYWLDVSDAPFVATILDAHGANVASGFKGDVEIHNSSGEYSAIQVEGLHVVPFTPATQSDDQQLFHAMHWFDAEPNADIPGAYLATAEEKEVAIILERGAFFYLRQLEHQIPADHPGRSDQYNAAYLKFAAHTHKMLLDGKHRYAQNEWLNDTLEDIVATTKPFSDRPEIRAMHVVGEQMPRAIRGETTMLEHLMMNGLLDDYYANSLSITKGTDVLAETVMQIARRYPHGKILEVGAGTGAATRQILKLIGDDFSSYTFTDVSAGFFDNAQSEFEPYKDRMIYSLLDLEQDMQTQGFEKHSYDLVVASFVLHATKSLEQTVRRVRSLLKPGGYLILYEVTNVEIIRGNALFGCLPGWWQGMEEGRTLGAAVTESKWDAILRKTGFSGIDTMTPIHDALPLPNSVLVSQAVDDWVEFIREPLLARPSLFMGRSIIKHLFIVGGTTFRVSRLIEDVQKLIRLFCEDITRVESLEELNHGKVDSNATVLILEDLDKPVFKDITEARFGSLKKLFGSEKTLVWVTQDRMIDNPFANMPVGFARSALWEVPDIQYQFIDFQDVHKIDARVLTEAVLRFQASGSVQEQSQRNTLWSVESEIIIKSDGRQLIPRLKPASHANDRYNSARRTITKEINPQECPVVIANVDCRYVLREQSTPSSVKANTGANTAISMKLSHSTLRAIRTVFGDAFVVLGNCAISGAQYLGLTDSPISLVEIPPSSLIPSSVAPQSEALFLSLLAANLLLPVITAGLAEEDSLLIHEAPALMATILGRHAKLAAIKLIYTTASRTEAKQKKWIHVDRYSRQSQLKSLLPLKVSRYIDFSTLERSSAQPSPIESCLPPDIQIMNIFTLFPSKGTLIPKIGSEVNDILKVAMTSALADLSTWSQDCALSSQINVRDVAEKAGLRDVFTVIEWNTPSLSITVQPVEAQFNSDRTYWLVGLSGDLGISIADWMIRNGAKTLVITSRNPKVDKAWLENANRRGTVVRVMSK